MPAITIIIISPGPIVAKFASYILDEPIEIEQIFEQLRIVQIVEQSISARSDYTRTTDFRADDHRPDGGADDHRADFRAATHRAAYRNYIRIDFRADCNLTVVNLVDPASRRNLVDPASSHMLISKIKPCMSQYKLVSKIKPCMSQYMLLQAATKQHPSSTGAAPKQHPSSTGAAPEQHQS